MEAYTVGVALGGHGGGYGKRMHGHDQFRLTANESLHIPTLCGDV